MIESDDLVGAIVRDITADESVRYAVGWSGYLCLRTGDFIPYDTAFTGPESFRSETFEIEEPPLTTPTGDG